MGRGEGGRVDVERKYFDFVDNERFEDFLIALDNLATTMLQYQELPQFFFVI